MCAAIAQVLCARTIGSIEVDDLCSSRRESAGYGLPDAVGCAGDDDSADRTCVHFSALCSALFSVLFSQAKAFSVTTMRAKRLVWASVSARVGLGFSE